MPPTRIELATLGYFGLRARRIVGANATPKYITSTLRQTPRPGPSPGASTVMSLISPSPLAFAAIWYCRDHSWGLFQSLRVVPRM